MDRVVLAFSKDETANKIKMMLDGSGYDVYTVCHSKAELLRTVADMDEVLIIMTELSMMFMTTLWKVRNL